MSVGGRHILRGMDRPLLIVNPRSGSRRTGRRLPELAAAVARTLGPVDVALTGWRGHGIELARRAVDEARELVVAVGGDGTLNEVVNGVLEAAAGSGATPAAASAAQTGTHVGLIAAGTGADFGRTLGLGRTLEAQIEALASGRERVVDVARAEVDGPQGERLTRYFINILSAGPGGLVARYVQDLPRALGGRAGYYLASVLALARSPRAELLVTVADGETTAERTLSTYVLAVCNGQVFGGGYRIAPMARLDDGRLEVISAGVDTRLRLVRSIHTSYRGEHLGIEGVEHFSCRRLTAELVDPRLRERFLMEIDGEELGRLPLSVEVLPGALKLRV